MNKFLLIFLLLPRLVFAAVAYDNSATSQGEFVATLTITAFTVAATNPLILCAAATKNQGTTGVTYNSVAMTQIGTTVIQSNTNLSLWRLVGQSGTHNAVFTFATDISLQATVGCASFTGVDQTTPVGTDQTSTDYISAPMTITVPTNGMGFNAAAAFSAGPGCGMTPDSPQTSRYVNCLDFGPAASTEIGGATIASTSAMSWTDGGGSYMAQIGVAINEVAAAPTGVARRSVIGVQ